MRESALPTWITHTVAYLALGMFSQAAPPKAATEATAVPSLESRNYVGPLADAYSRIDPTKDGWNTEALNEAANEQLHLLQSWLTNMESDSLPALSKSFRSTPWIPSQLNTAFSADGLTVRRSINKAASKPSMGLKEAASTLQQAFAPGSLKLKFKLYRVDPKPNSTQFLTNVRVEASGLAPNVTPKAKKQHVAEWNLTWERKGLQAELMSITLQAFEEVVHAGASAPVIFEDRTHAVLGDNASYHEQLLNSTDHWRSRISRDFGVDVVANHGMALGDVNGDLLDDVYLCMQGGLPNRLYLRQSDGTLKDVSRESGADWLDYCASALIVDFNNDGHRDLVVGQEWRLLFMENDGKGHFELAFGLGTMAQTYSLAAAGYNGSTNSIRQGAMGEPMPYHDAQNGGPSMLLRNDGNWEFNEATAEVGMDHNNNRFSFAASWEDYDNDGDLDLYVANDYGRNNLYQQTNGRFIDIASELGLEDMSSGMSVAWGDYNRDGNMDLYVSNMFSAAGNRITYQRQFQTQTDDSIRKVFQRHARGNSLFESIGKGQFQDVSVERDVTMGRWAWGSAFIDVNNDSWQDLIVANGFISAEDTGDL